MAEARKTSGLWSWLQFVLAASFIGWCSLEGARFLWRSWQVGILLHGKGPDIALSDKPLVFWGLSGFYGASVLLGGGFAVFCLLIAFREMIPKRGAGR
ncbi:MAG TPA: hypothetical protein VLZ51_04830 [Brevundimonas sp.]|nr:hypothetical protein [Brevundimonas sp.]